MKLTHEWTTKSGLKVVATCKLILTEKIYADGEIIEVVACKKEFGIEVVGKGTMGSYITRKAQCMDGVEYPATCGQLVIAQKNLDEIDKMVAKIENHPAWIAKKAAAKKARKIEQEYQAHRAKMTKAMGY